MLRTANQRLTVKKTILIVAPDPRLDRELSAKLRPPNYQILWSGNFQESLRRLDLNQVDLMLLDLDVPLPGSWSALAGLSLGNPHLRIVGITERSDVMELAVEARLSALAERPVNFRELVPMIEQLLAQPSEVTGFRYLPRTLWARHSAHHGAVALGHAPAGYREWGINE